MIFTNDAEWVGQAACRGMATRAFFPVQGENTARPKSVCAGCLVRMECLEHALSVPEVFGIWGGLSERERRRIRRYRNRSVMEPNQDMVAS